MGKGVDKQMVRGCQIHIYLWLIKRPLSAQHGKKHHGFWEAIDYYFFLLSKDYYNLSGRKGAQANHQTHAQLWLF